MPELNSVAIATLSIIEPIILHPKLQGKDDSEGFSLENLSSFFQIRKIGRISEASKAGRCTAKTMIKTLKLDG
jgi:hypothetical protein